MQLDAKKRKKMDNSRTENTICGLKGISAERRLTKRTKKDELEEEQKKLKELTDNVRMGDEVMKYIKNLKSAQATLTSSNLPVEIEYW